jgi:myosin heavy subunit
MGKRNKSHRQGKNMSKEVKPMRGMRLSLIARKANLSLGDIVNLLKSNGYGELDSSPNTKITIDWVRGINEVYPLGFEEDKNLSEYPIKKLDVIPPLTKRENSPSGFFALLEALRKVNSFPDVIEIENLIKEAEQEVEETKKEAEEAKKEADVREKKLQKVVDVKEKKLQKVVKENKALKSGKYKRSSHLTDQMLKYNYPKDRQPSLFDTLKSETLKDIEVAGVERYEVVEGIRLTPSETKIIDSLCKLLHQNSQTLEPKNKDYYTGNLTPDMVDYEAEITPAPKLGFTLYELTKEYKGEDSISGKDVENVKQVLYELNEKKFCIRYTEQTKGKGGEWVKKEYEKFRSIIHVDKATLSYNLGSKDDYKKAETVIVLHPIFRRQIDSKFIFYPDDINKRIAIAYGSHNVSEITLRLRDYLMREISSKRPNPEIGEEKLYYLLAEKWMRESRKKKVKEYTEKALSTMIALGILKSYKIEPAKTTGEPKVVFTLNMDWE